MKRLSSKWKAIRQLFQRELVKGTSDPHLVALAFSLGICLSIAPIWGFQTMTAVGLAHVLKLNKPLVLLGTALSLTPLLPLILYGSYLFGKPFFSSPMPDSVAGEIGTHLGQYVIGASLLAFTAGILSYLVIRAWFWVSRQRKL